MKSKWKVSSQTIDGEKFYTVFRIRDTSQTDHSGNREVYDTYLSKEMAEMEADELNRKEIYKQLP